jgi:hypothetical protein
VKSPSLKVAERIVEAAGYRLALVTQVQFEPRTASGVTPFWVPDRLWRGRLPECFARVVLEDRTRFQGHRRWDLRKRGQRRTMYEMLLRRGQPDELVDWIDGALLVDLWEDLRVPQVIRRAGGRAGWERSVGEPLVRAAVLVRVRRASGRRCLRRPGAPRARSATGRQ